MAGQFTSLVGLNGHSPYSMDEYFIRSDSIKSVELDDTGERTAFRANHMFSSCFVLLFLPYFERVWDRAICMVAEFALHMRGRLFHSRSRNFNLFSGSVYMQEKAKVQDFSVPVFPLNCSCLHKLERFWMVPEFFKCKDFFR